MSRFAILYASKFGQTGRIAERIATELRDRGADAITSSLGPPASDRDPSDYDALVLGAPIYFGRHRKALRRFVLANSPLLEGRPSFFFSVSLAAAGEPEKAKGAARGYRDAFLAEAGWQPEASACFAGSLPYRDYNPFLRWMMRRIVRKEGGNTDTSQNHEYTDWRAVAAFAGRCFELAG